MRIWFEPIKYPYGIQIYCCDGNWFVERKTVVKIEELAIFDEEYKARRFAQKLILKEGNLCTTKKK